MHECSPLLKGLFPPVRGLKVIEISICGREGEGAGHPGALNGTLGKSTLLNLQYGRDAGAERRVISSTADGPIRRMRVLGTAPQFRSGRQLGRTYQNPKPFWHNERGSTNLLVRRCPAVPLAGGCRCVHARSREGPRKRASELTGSEHRIPR